MSKLTSLPRQSRVIHAYLSAMSARVQESILRLTAGQEWETADEWLLARRLQDTLDSINGGTIEMTAEEQKVYDFIIKHSS